MTTTTEYSVARVTRSGELQPSAIAVWPEIDRAQEYMLWMNGDMARALREEADKDPNSKFAAVHKDYFEGTHCVVVEREVSEWRVAELVKNVAGAGYPWQPSDLQVASEW